MTSNHEASPSVDPDLLVGYVEGRLDDDERAAVEARLVRDEEARALVGELRAALGTEAPVPVTASRSWAPLAIAACALLAVGALVFAMTRGDPVPQDPYARLLAHADRLAAADPVQFGSLRATIEDASLIGEAEAMRGGLRIFAPQGALLDGRPQLRWTEVPGSKGYEVRVAMVTGTEVLTFRSETAMASWPDEAAPLVGGQQYLLEIRAQGPFGERTGTTLFRVADADTRAAAEQAWAAIEAQADGVDRDLLLAYHALRHGRYARVADLLAGLLADAPEDPRVLRLQARMAPMQEPTPGK